MTGATRLWAEKNSSFDRLQRNYSPDHWPLMIANPARAYRWDCPLLSRLDALYGRGAAAQWADQQVTALFLASGSRDGSLAAASIGTFAPSFAGAAGGCKLSELMLFFARYKAGAYDRSYAAFDPRRIGLAFHYEFLPDRRRERAALEALERGGTEEAGRESRRLHAVSYERFHRAPPGRLYGLRMRLLVPPASVMGRKVCRYVGAPLPRAAGEPFDVTLTRPKMRMLVRWDTQHVLAVDDSWEMPAGE